MRYKTSTLIKSALLCTAFTYSIPVLHADNKPVNLGLTVTAGESIFNGGDTRFRVRPARINNNGFYIEGAVLPFQASPTSTLYVGLGFDEWSHKRDDSKALSDMGDLDRAVNLRLGGAWKLSTAVVSADFSGDVAGAHQGLKAKVRYTRMPSENTTFRPYAELQWLSADFTDYYVGVNANEVTAERPAYEADAALAGKVGLDLNFSLSRRFELVAGVHYTHYDSQVGDSPIVGQDNVWGGGIGLVYK